MIEIPLRKNISLTELSMASNKLLNKGTNSDRGSIPCRSHALGVVIIIKAVKETPRMMTFNFNDNSLSKDLCALLDSMLQQNKVLTDLSFGDNQFGTPILT